MQCFKAKGWGFFTHALELRDQMDDDVILMMKFH